MKVKINNQKYEIYGTPQGKSEDIQGQVRHSIEIFFQNTKDEVMAMGWGNGVKWSLIDETYEEEEKSEVEYDKSSHCILGKVSEYEENLTSITMCEVTQEESIEGLSKTIEELTEMLEE